MRTLPINFIIVILLSIAARSYHHSTTYSSTKNSTLIKRTGISDIIRINFIDINEHLGIRDSYLTESKTGRRLFYIQTKGVQMMDG